MISYVWPIGLVVISNIVYQICSKSVPAEISPFASLTVTYVTAAIFCAAVYLLTGKGSGAAKDFTSLNWAPFVLGIVIVGLEVGFIYAYQAGWQVSTASIVQSSFLAIGLLIVGALLYHESLTWNKLLGVVICMIGLVFMNMK